MLLDVNRLIFSCLLSLLGPGTVSNLMVSDNTDISLNLSWSRLPGEISGYRVVATNDSN